MRSAVAFALCCAGLPALIVGCSRSAEKPAPEPNTPPNILWIVWDTVRADHLSLYGYGKKTTPFLDEWAKDARVYDDCRSVAGYTIPSHASMFTGLLPSQHGAHNGHQVLDRCHVTVAELLEKRGYQTYLYSANPHISMAKNFSQGFQAEQHPYDEELRPLAIAILKSKIQDEDVSSELPERIRAGQVHRKWDLKASGALAQRCTEAWLRRRDRSRPYFVLLNYMEAHRPYVPPRSCRARVMTEEQVEASYKVDRSWLPMWEYTFRLRDYAQEDLAVMAATYDATLVELDDLLRNLLDALDAKGDLNNTLIILTSDHGEHLGEHHMFDHQYSLYEPVLHVPLVMRYAPAFEAGRCAKPVMNFDIFPTLLELVGIAPPLGLDSKAVSLLSPLDRRKRYAEEPSASTVGTEAVLQVHPDFDPTPWRRALRAVVDGPTKFIWASDGSHELYDLREDPGEQSNLAGQSARVSSLAKRIEDYFGKLRLRCEDPGEQHVP